MEPRIAVTLNGREAARTGMDVLRRGGSALDAVEAAVRVIEDNADDWSVGLGGFPNFAGHVELDASIADGRTRRLGAVAGLRRHRQAVSVARRVMERTPHVLLVGEGADRFADAEGFEPSPLLTGRMARTYEALMRGEEIELWPRVEEEPPEGARRYGRRLAEVARDRAGWREVFCAEMQGGTCNALAVDREGRIASAVSTSGLALKMPGRVGDSPVPGAGNYADERFGAAACAGNGELCLRLASARMAVASMAQGCQPAEAAGRAVRELEDLPGRSGGFQILVMAPDGREACASNIKQPRYYAMAEADEAPRLCHGELVDVASDPGLS